MGSTNKDWLAGQHYVFNHDLCAMALLLDQTDKSEKAVSRIFVAPFADTDIDVLDVCILSTATHLVGTRYSRIISSPQMPEYLKCLIGIGRHYADTGADLLEIIVKHAHVCGKKVLASLRLNHNLPGNTLADIPGRTFCQGKTLRKDFRDASFHQWLCDVTEDLLQKGIDGITLDFLRKSPFFPDDAPQQERFDACRDFLRKIRALSDMPIVVRVSHTPEDGNSDGQDPEQWLREGLVDVVVPATPNHDPDYLDWPIERFVSATKSALAPAYVWPQIWPVRAAWVEREFNLQSPADLLQRAKALQIAGADGVYFFNFCCGVTNEDEIQKTGKLIQNQFLPSFQQLSTNR